LRETKKRVESGKGEPEIGRGTLETSGRFFLSLKGGGGKKNPRKKCGEIGGHDHEKGKKKKKGFHLYRGVGPTGSGLPKEKKGESSTWGAEKEKKKLLAKKRGRGRKEGRGGGVVLRRRKSKGRGALRIKKGKKEKEEIFKSL